MEREQNQSSPDQRQVPASSGIPYEPPQSPLMGRFNSLTESLPSSSQGLPPVRPQSAQAPQGLSPPPQPPHRSPPVPSQPAQNPHNLPPLLPPLPQIEPFNTQRPP